MEVVYVNCTLGSKQNGGVSFSKVEKCIVISTDSLLEILCFQEHGSVDSICHKLGHNEVFLGGNAEKLTTNKNGGTLIVNGSGPGKISIVCGKGVNIEIL